MSANNSIQDEVQSFTGQLEHEAHEMEELSKVISRSHSFEGEVNQDNALSRLSTLSRTLSRLTSKQMSKFEINKEDFDLQKILKFLQRQDDEQGLGKSTNVVFENLDVIANNTSASIAPTTLEILFGPVLAAKKALSNEKESNKSIPKQEKTRKLIRNVTGYVKPGEMLLVLGRPGAGCSTMLKAISGETRAFIKTEGSVSFNGIDQATMMQRFKNQVIYNPELDVHFPHLTVEQTLKFAIACRTPNVRFNNISRTEYVDNILDLWSTVFGLSHVYKTKVGNDYVRGVSGGQRKRVSIAEAMVTRASVYSFDNATRGLDASTALEFIETLRAATNITKSTSLVTIYQAGEGIYKTFDKVTVLYLGRQIYFGPADQAKQYFVDLGFECLPRQTTSEFLTAVTDPLGRTTRAGMEGIVPNTADEFEKIWLQSKEYKNLLDEVNELKNSTNIEESINAFQAIKDIEIMKYTRSKSRYTINFIEQFKLCLTRCYQNLWNNIAFTMVNLVFNVIVQALIVGSCLYNIPESTAGAFSRGGVIYLCIFHFVFTGLFESLELFTYRDILQKQKGYSFYHPAAETLANILSLFPIRVVFITIFNIVVYFLAHLKVDAGSFFTFELFVVLTVQCLSCMFSMLASLSATLDVFMAISGLIVYPILLYCSYLIQRPSMVPWFKWYSYMDPVLYGFEAALTTEFHGRVMRCSDSDLIPSGQGYENVASENQVCAFVGSTGSEVLGDRYVALSYNYSFSHVWRNFGILILFTLGFLVINLVVVEIYHPVGKSGDVLLLTSGSHIPDIDGNGGDEKKRDLESSSVDYPSSSSSNANKAATGKAFIEKDTPENTVKLGSDDIFTWKHLDYVIKYDGNDRKLLDDVQGFVKPGTLTALMGESGAGKTTLLNALSERVEMGIITGEMLVNGVSAGASFKRKTGYVQQQDIHVTELTVRESLIFAARLRRPVTVPDYEKVSYVDEIIDILEMNEYRDALVGVPGTGLNVEQRKKLSIATELVAKPELLLFLDEPTSGLDSQSSWAIVQVLRSLANAGQAILCTIHQPSAILFECFDSLLLLKVGGQTVYFGDIGEHSSSVLSYFEQNGGRKFESHENPAEYILEVIGAGATATVHEDWHQIWCKSPQYAQLSIEIDNIVQNGSGKNLSSEHSKDGDSFAYATPYLYQLRYVIQRGAVQSNRNYAFHLGRAFFLIVSGLFVGFSFWNVKHTIVGMQNLMFANLFATLAVYSLASALQGSALKGREIYEVRESKSKTYHWSTLFIAQFLNELPSLMCSYTIYFVCWYFPIQLDNSPSVAGFWWFTVCFLLHFFFTSFALMLAYISPDLPSASILFGFIMTVCVLFSGIFQPASLLPGFWKFMWRVSPITYILEMTLSTLLHGREVHCSDIELSYLDPPQGQTCGVFLSDYFETHTGYVSNPDATSQCGVCKYSVGDEYLHSLGMSYGNRWRDVGFLWVYTIFNFFVMFVMYYFLRVKKLDFSGLFKKSKKKTN
ncbi:unnamed protein product [[Candida] boidinii]|uniref:Unnamed protein product n=1 Tax=Candida boidinii TaxID=5477 RepID=A0A9W6SXD8_CANBO|nr:hypothetical protein B5S30_g3654 [[Candida] boidinii]GME68028.1 unnamed protein product [[Candida] boidinii]